MGEIGFSVLRGTHPLYAPSRIPHPIPTVLEVPEDLREADDTSADPATRLRGMTAAFHDFGMAYPAFVDCAQMLMRNTGTELFE